jgi:hypothetical protein
MNYETKTLTESPFIWPIDVIFFGGGEYKVRFFNFNFVAYFSAHQQSAACGGHTTPIITHLS